MARLYTPEKPIYSRMSSEGLRQKLGMPLEVHKKTEQYDIPIKLIANHVPPYPAAKFTTNSIFGYTNTCGFSEIHLRSEFYQSSFKFRGAKLYNLSLLERHLLNPTPLNLAFP